MSVDPANAQKAEQDRKTNHAMLVVEKEEDDRQFDSGCH